MIYNVVCPSRNLFVHDVPIISCDPRDEMKRPTYVIGVGMTKYE
jgi:hypothetical protein